MDMESLDLQQQEPKHTEVMAKENNRSIKAKRKSQLAMEEARLLRRVLKATKGTSKHSVDKVT